MNLISRAKTNHLRDVGKDRAERGIKTASDRLHKVVSDKADEAESRMGKVESLVSKKVNELQDEAKDRFTTMATKRIDDLESRLEQLKGRLPPTKSKRRSSFIGNLLMFSMVVSGAVAAACIIKSKLRGHEGEVPFETTYGRSGGSSSNGHEPRGPRSVGGHLDNNDIADDRGERPSGNSADPRPESRSQTSATSPNNPASAKLNEPLGKEVVDMKGESIGQVERVYYRRPSWEPEWVGVVSGLTAKKTYLVPLSNATAGETIKLAYSKEQVEMAPQADLDGSIGEETEMQAYQHYNLRRELPAASKSVDDDETKLHSWPLQPQALAS